MNSDHAVLAKKDDLVVDEGLVEFGTESGILPIQYLDEQRRSSQLSDEKRLMVAILKEAIDCYTKYFDSRSPSDQRLFKEAEEWIISEDTSWLFSFENICAHLDIEAAYLRQGLRRWKERKLKAIQQAKAADISSPSRKKPDSSADCEGEVDQECSPSISSSLSSSSDSSSMSAAG